MKKTTFLFLLFLSISAFANDRGAGISYQALYGKDAFYDLYHEPILKMTNTDLEKSNLLGRLDTIPQQITYQGGDIFMQTPQINGVKEGVQKIYYKSSVLLAEIPYQNNMINGEVKVYYPTGNIKMQLTYQNNMPIGTGKMFHENGNIALTQNYQNGLIHGQQIRYFNDGQSIQSILNYNQGKLNGKSKLYYENKNLLTEVNFIDNKAKTAICYDKHQNKAPLNDIGIYKIKWGIRPVYCPTWTEFGDYHLTNGF